MAENKLSDEEIRLIYAKIDPDSIRYREPDEWWAETIAVTRRALEAQTLQEAVDILRSDGWSDPEFAAKTIRAHVDGESAR